MSSGGGATSAGAVTDRANTAPHRTSSPDTAATNGGASDDELKSLARALGQQAARQLFAAAARQSEKTIAQVGQR